MWRLPACWVTQWAAGWAVTPAIPDEAGVVVDEEQHIGPPEEHGVDAEEVAGDEAFRPAARNSAQDGPDRRGEGSMPWRLRIAQTLDGAIGMPMVASWPWMRR